MEIELREKRLPSSRRSPGNHPVHAASTAVDRKLPDHHGVPLSESVQVRVLRLDREAAVKTRTTQKGARRLDRVGLQRLSRHPAGAAVLTPLGPAGALRRARTRCAPPVRSQGPPGRSHAERTRRHRPGRRARARAPTWSGGTSPPTGRESRWVGDITYIRTWEGFVYLATVPGCCTKKAVGYAIGATTCAPTPLCEAIDMAAHRCPHTTGETVFHPRPGVPVHLRATRPASGEI